MTSPLPRIDDCDIQGKNDKYSRFVGNQSMFFLELSLKLLYDTIFVIKRNIYDAVAQNYTIIRRYLMEISTWVSVFIAGLALLVSIFTVGSQIRHNKLTLMPICEIYTYNFTNRMAIDLLNKGMGPLQVTRIYFYSKSGEKFISIPNLIDSANEIENIHYEFNLIKVNKVISANETISLFELEDSSYDKREQIFDLFTNLYIHIDYKDVYSHSYAFDYSLAFIK